MKRAPAVSVAVFLAVSMLGVSQTSAQGLLLNSGSAGIVRINETTGAPEGVLIPTGSGPGQLFPTFGMAFGPSGDLFVASGNNSHGCEVLRYSVSGQFLGVFVSPPASGGPSCDGVTFGPDGNLYTTDRILDVVQRYNGQTGAYIDDFVTAGSGGLNGPMSLAFGPDGALYVTSLRNNSVFRYNGTTGAYLSTFVPAMSGGLMAPVGLAFGPDGQFVCDQLLLTGRLHGAALQRSDGCVRRCVRLGCRLDQGRAQRARRHHLRP